MFPFGSVPPLVGVAGQLLAPAPAPAPAPPPPLPVVSLPLLAQPYPPPPLPLVQPLAPQLVLHPQLPRAPPPPPLLLRPPLPHAVVKPPVTTKVLSAPCVAKSPPTVKAVTTTSAVKAPPTANGSDGASEPNESSGATLGSTNHKSEDKCEAVVKEESGCKRDTNASVPEVTAQTKRCEKPSAEEEEQEAPPAEVSSPLCSDTGNTKVKKMKHVMILDEDRKLCVELPLEKDNTLALKLLQRHFPGVCGLTYRSLHCPHRQWIALEAGKLRAPKGGWEHDAYYCVFSKQSGGKWLHTFCHCSLSKPSKGKQARSPVKSPSNKNNSVKNRVNELSDKKAQSEEPDVYVVEDDGEKDGRRCSEVVVCSLPQWVTEERLREHFGQFGKVATCGVKKDLVGARYGLVRFRDLPSQEKALAEVFHRFGDTWCSVRLRS